jgi:hypothetical protein
METVIVFDRAIKEEIAICTPRGTKTIVEAHIEGTERVRDGNRLIASDKPIIYKKGEDFLKFLQAIAFYSCQGVYIQIKYSNGEVWTREPYFEGRSDKELWSID